MDEGDTSIRCDPWLLALVDDAVATVSMNVDGYGIASTDERHDVYRYVRSTIDCPASTDPPRPPVRSL